MFSIIHDQELQHIEEFTKMVLHSELKQQIVEPIEVQHDHQKIYHLLIEIQLKCELKHQMFHIIVQ